jgi:hypothetical protein
MGVDLVDVRGELGLEVALDGGGGHGGGRDLGDAAGVEDFDAVDGMRAVLGGEAAEALAEVENGGEALEFAGVDGGDVDGVADHAAFEGFDDLRGDVAGDFFLGLDGGGGEVGGEDDIVEGAQGVIGGEGFLAEDVEGGAGDAFGGGRRRGRPRR